MRFQASSVTTEFERRWHPKEGDIVSFKHHGFLAATQKPKLASLYRIRTDITWNEVVDSWKAGKPLPQGTFTLMFFELIPLTLSFLTASPLQLLLEEKSRTQRDTGGI